MHAVDWTALREPNLLIPGRKPVGPVKVDLTNQLARDLFDSYLLSPSHGRNSLIYNSQQIATAAGAFKGDNLVFTPADSSHLAYDAGGGGGGAEFDLIENIEKFTVATLVDMASIAADHFIAEHIQSNFQNGWALFFDDVGVNGNDVFEFFVGGGSGNYTRAAPSTSHGGGKYHVAGVFDGSLSSNNRAQIYVNGVNESIGASAGTVPTTTGSPSTEDYLYVGEHGNPLDLRYFDGTIFYTFLWARALQQDEIVALYKDPYQFLIPV